MGLQSHKINTSRGENEVISHHYYILYSSDKNRYASFKHEYKSFIQIKFNTLLGQNEGRGILSHALKINSQDTDETGKEKAFKGQPQKSPCQ